MSNFQYLQNGGSEKQDSLHEQRIKLEEDIAELQKKLMDEQGARHAMETAMGRRTWGSSMSPGHRHLSPQAKELIYEINYLEEEVVDLEKHVLSLYRHFFRNSSYLRPSTLVQEKATKCGANHEAQQDHEMQQKSRKQLLHSNPTKPTKLKQSQYAHSCCKMSKTNEKYTTQRAAFSTPPTPSHSSSMGLSKSRSIKDHFHSLDSGNPNRARTKLLKDRFTKSNPSSLNEDRPTRILREYLSYSPNKLSEELVRCMTAIYCKIADPPLPNLHEVLESPSSCTSSSLTSISSTMHGMLSDGWSPGFKGACDENPSDTSPSDPFQAKELGRRRNKGAYAGMVEVLWIKVDRERLNIVSYMLRDFRSMVEQLENVDPGRLKHEEKLAFWINIYNALLMHAYLAYGIPRNNLKRMTLLQRAAYKVGGKSIDAYTIEHSILRCRSHRPTQWLQNLLLPGSKFKSNDEKRMYAISKPEPLVCFALCCGGQSDPAVRAYTAKNVRKELEAARKEFLQETICFQSEDKKLLLPKILEWYTREASISSSNLLQWVSQYLDEEDRGAMLRCKGSTMKSPKSTVHCNVEWMAYSFSFRYIFERELAFGSSSHLQH